MQPAVRPCPPAGRFEFQLEEIYRTRALSANSLLHEALRYDLSFLFTFFATITIGHCPVGLELQVFVLYINQVFYSI